MSLQTPQAPASDAAGPDRKIQVMVVDDSVVVRGLVSRWLGEEPSVEVVAKHSNGLKAVNDLADSDPDVVVLDIEMPEMDGMTALEKMLKIKPGLLVVMASTLTRRNAEISLEALKLGAADYIPKPESNSGVTTSMDFRREVVEKVLALGARALADQLRSTVRRPGGAPAPVGPAVISPAEKTPAAARPAETRVTAPAATAAFSLRPMSRVMPRLLAIGSSTGGPQALLEMFKTVGPYIDRVPTVITQHMPPTFTAILAEHLAKATGLQAGEARDGEAIEPGHVYVAPGAKHFTLEDRDGAPHVKLSDGPAINFCKPAVDPMFESAVKIYGAASLAVILTGMGSDGRDGARKIADAGGSVIAQDEATSVVWGMPGAAAMAGVCAAVLPLSEIGHKVRQVLGR